MSGVRTNQTPPQLRVALHAGGNKVEVPLAVFPSTETFCFLSLFIVKSGDGFDAAGHPGWNESGVGRLKYALPPPPPHGRCDEVVVRDDHAVL